MDRNLNAVQIVVVIVVALRKESVDRNSLSGSTKPRARRESLSARRAWIEIDAPSSAPYAELSRSPQGERG